MATHEEIAYKWGHFVAYGTGKNHGGGRTSRVTYSGYDFYSYNTVIIRVVEHNGTKVGLVTRDSYSTSTQKHRRHGENGLHLRSIKTFRVPFIGRQGGWNGSDTRDFGNEASEKVHEGNVVAYQDMLIAFMAQAEKAYLHTHVDGYYGWRSMLLHICAEALEYMNTFEIGRVSVAGTEITRQDFMASPHIARIEAIHAEKMALYMDPKRVRARARARARRDLRKAMNIE